MSPPQTFIEIPWEHVTFEVEATDRMYLNTDVLGLPDESGDDESERSRTVV